MDKSKVLITGASGLLGRALFKEFDSIEGLECMGLAFSRSGGKLRKVDLTSKQEVSGVIKEFKPNVIIHSAAERRADVVDKQQETTKALNVTATRTICEEAVNCGAIVVYISTDYVFDGTKPPYKENDTPTPLNKYGESKYEGEKVVIETSKDNIILRVPIIYGLVEDLEESAVTVIFKNVLNHSSCSMSDYERRFPTYAADIAAVLCKLLDKRQEDNSLCGYFHWTAEDNLTKYDMAVAMAELFDLPTSHILADKKPSAGAKRPFDVHLDSSRLEKLGICVRTPFKEGIEPCLRPFIG